MQRTRNQQASYQSLMIVPWLIFIAVGLITYAGFVKLAARLLR
jgi:hypothetical protein